MKPKHRQFWKPSLLGTALLLPCLPALAIPTMYPRLRDQEIRTGLLANTYLTPSGEANSDAGTGNLSLAVGVRGTGRKNDIHFGVEGETLLGLRKASYRYVDIGELYLGMEKKETASRPYVYLGRKRFEWNQLDSYWGLGLFQPRFRWDYLNERENGLFGIFLGYQTETFQATAYYSPIFIPEQGAPFDISSGNCRSSSPWFSCPSSTIRIFNQPTDVRFSLDVPPIKSLIEHGGGGATLHLGRQLGPFARLSYAHKPMNQLLLSFEGRLNVAEYEVPAKIRPRVLYHHLYALDFGFNSEKYGITTSAVAERPERDFTPASWNTQESTPAELYGITVRSRPFENMRYTRLEASYFLREGGVAPDQGPFVTPGTNYFEPRFAFKNAYSLAIFTPLLDQWARRLLLSGKFIVDSINDGNLLVMDAFYSPLRGFVVNFGADILGSNNSNPVDFLSRYQRNDRLRGGVAYVF